MTKPVRYASGVNELLHRRRGPFLVLLVFGIVVCIAVIQIPDTFLARVARNRPLSDAQAGWAYRLIAIAAIVQILYGGFAIFRIERVQAARERDQRFAQMPHERVVSSLSRNAAGMVVLTLIYGLATIAVSGLRGGFWLFPLLALAQAAWYYRELGQIARWKAFQPAPVEESRERGRWTPHDSDYVPPLTRGLRPRG